MAQRPRKQEKLTCILRVPQVKVRDVILKEFQKVPGLGGKIGANPEGRNTISFRSERNFEFDSCLRNRFAKTRHLEKRVPDKIFAGEDGVSCGYGGHCGG